MKRRKIWPCLLFAMLWLPIAGIAGEGAPVANQPAVDREAQPHSGPSSTSSASEPKSPTKHQNKVQSRGLFKKKKKKQKSGSAKHSQPSELADPHLSGEAGR